MGDALLAAAFVSYAAPFTMDFRQELVAQKWLPDLEQRAIPLTPGKLPLQLLATDTDKVQIFLPKPINCNHPGFA